jgi:hypothetical protein
MPGYSSKDESIKYTLLCFIAGYKFFLNNIKINQPLLSNG